MYNNYLEGVLNVAPDVSRIQSEHGVGQLFGIALNVAVGVGVSVSVIYIILAGIRFMMSQGDPKATEQAKQALTYSIYAFILSTAVFAVKALIFNILGVTSPDLTGGTPTF